jgi:predicted nucleotidyltransferase
MTFTVNNKKLTLHFLTVVGSTLHNLNGLNSDVDVKGVFTWDNEELLGLNEPADTLDKKNMSENDRFELMSELEVRFGRKFDDDLDLFEAKKFFKNAMKSDPNMLDMLWANEVSGMVLFCSNEFKKVLDNRMLFLNFELAKKRFLGMSFNTFKLGSKENNKNNFKDLAKSLQSLFSFKNLVENKEFSPRLKESQRREVLAVKNNSFFKEHKELVALVKVMRQDLEDECDQLELPESDNDLTKLNSLLLSLRGL